MENYLTIGDLSKLSGSSVRSLRYYDQIGILKPAYINEDTGYRYYTAEQLATLSMIQACTELDIPLKNFEDYKTEEGTFDLYRLVQIGETLAHQKIHHLEQIVQKLESLSEYLTTVQNIGQKKTPFVRQIKKRKVATAPFYGDIRNEYERMKAMTDLYLKMKACNIAVLYQQGFLFQCENNGEVIPYCFLEVIDDKKDFDYITEIPSGSYTCRVFLSSHMQQAYQEASENGTVIVEYLDEKQNRYVEVQKIK